MKTIFHSPFLCWLQKYNFCNLRSFPTAAGRLYIFAHGLQRALFQTADLGLRDGNLIGYLHLGFALKKPHVNNHLLSGRQLIQRLLNGDILQPLKISVLVSRFGP